MLLTDTDSLSQIKKKKKLCIQVVIWNVPKMFSIIPRIMSDLPWKFHKNLSMLFSIMLYTDRQTNKDENTTFTIWEVI